MASPSARCRIASITYFHLVPFERFQIEFVQLIAVERFAGVRVATRVHTAAEQIQLVANWRARMKVPPVRFQIVSRFYQCPRICFETVFVYVIAEFLYLEENVKMTARARHDVQIYHYIPLGRSPQICTWMSWRRRPSVHLGLRAFAHSF